MITIMNALIIITAVGLGTYVFFGLCATIFIDYEFFFLTAKIALITAFVSFALFLIMCPFAPENYLETESSREENVEYNYCPNCGEEIK